MTVDAVVAGVGFAADEPFRIRHVAFERFIEILKPVDVLTSQVAPETGRIVLCPIPHFLILLFRADMSRSRKLR